MKHAGIDSSFLAMTPDQKYQEQNSKRALQETLNFSPIKNKTKTKKIQDSQARTTETPGLKATE